VAHSSSFTNLLALRGLLVDGSIDLIFGPEPPSSHRGNWIQTVPGKSWYAILHLYGPFKPWCEKTWIPNDIEQL